MKSAESLSPARSIATPAPERYWRMGGQYPASIAASGLKAVRRVGFASRPVRLRTRRFADPGVKFERIYGLDISESLFPLLLRSGAEEFRYVNDASAFALGECLGGAACDARRVVALTLGTGVGSGFVSDRKLVTSGDEGLPTAGSTACRSATESWMKPSRRAELSAVTKS
ncbi:MAG: ROK family protein [Alistipes finegoldii]